MVEIKIAIVKLLQAFHLQSDETTRYSIHKTVFRSGTILKVSGGGGEVWAGSGDYKEMSSIFADQ
jgi:hypothetical protein